MSLISPNFAVKSIIFSPILAMGLFPKLLEKGVVYLIKDTTNINEEYESGIFLPKDLLDIYTARPTVLHEKCLDKITKC